MAQAREQALRAKRRRAARAPRTGRRARPRLRRRDHRRPRASAASPEGRSRHDARRPGHRAVRSSCSPSSSASRSISKVPVVLHTPLMSGTNAIHGIVIVGAIVVLGSADDGARTALGFVASCSRREPGRRLRRHRPHARDVQERGRRETATDELSDAATSIGLRLPRRDRLLHPRAQGPARPAHARAGQPDRRRRHAGRDRRDARSLAGVAQLRR